MSNYAFIEQDSISELHYVVPQNWKNISNFNVLTDEDRKKLGWVSIIKNIPVFNTETDELVSLGHTIVGNEVHENFTTQPKYVTPELKEWEIEVIRQVEWQKVRQVRDEKMKEFEWRYNRHDREVRLSIDTSDSLTDLDEYMQALANITSQLDPYNIVWPEFTGI